MIAKISKEINREIKTILGGVYATMNPKRAVGMRILIHSCSEGECFWKCY